MKITNHLLQGDDVTFVSSPNRGGFYEEGALDTIIIHYTASKNAASAIQTLTDVEREVSAHLVIDRDGSITQLLPFNVIGWHAGISRWGKRESFNQYSIGIEIKGKRKKEEEKEGRANLISSARRRYRRAMLKMNSITTIRRKRRRQPR